MKVTELEGTVEELAAYKSQSLPTKTVGLLTEALEPSRKYANVEPTVIEVEKIVKVDSTKNWDKNCLPTAFERIVLGFIMFEMEPNFTSIELKKQMMINAPYLKWVTANVSTALSCLRAKGYLEVTNKEHKGQYTYKTTEKGLKYNGEHRVYKATSLKSAGEGINRQPGVQDNNSESSSKNSQGLQLPLDLGDLWTESGNIGVVQ